MGAIRAVAIELRQARNVKPKRPQYRGCPLPIRLQSQGETGCRNNPTHRRTVGPEPRWVRTEAVWGGFGGRGSAAV